MNVRGFSASRPPQEQPNVPHPYLASALPDHQVAELHRLMSAPWPRPAGLLGVLCGSGPLDTTLARRTLDHLGPVLFNQYGTTETGPLSLATPADLHAAPQ